VRDVPDYPSAGILFKDITPVLGDRGALRAAVEGMVALVHPDEIDVVVGIEARGFILGAAVALGLGTGFVPVRKVGKLPHRTHAMSYDLEYGSAEIEVHADAFAGARRALVVDDVLATGGTAAAACGLVERAGAQVVAFAVLIELEALGGRAALPERDVRSVLRV